MNKRVLRSIALICFVLVMPMQCFASSKCANETVCVKEDNYEQTMEQVVLPRIEEIRTEGYLKGEENVSLHYEKYITPGAKDSIVIFHGISEAAEKFYEFIYNLTENGYNVYLLEHRGHGDSERFENSNPSKVDVDKWQYLVHDQKMFIDTIVKPELPEDGKLFLYAHSMGGCVGTVYLETYTQDFDAAIINCPLYGYAIGIPNWIAMAITKSLTICGCGTEYVPGHGDYEETIDMNCALSGSYARVNYYNDQRISDINQHTYTTTNRFFSESYKMIAFAKSKKNVERINCPVLLFSAENDTTVSNFEQRKVASYSYRIKNVIVPKAKHEIYMESDEILAPYMAQLFSFFDSIV